MCAKLTNIRYPVKNEKGGNKMMTGVHGLNLYEYDTHPNLPKNG